MVRALEKQYDPGEFDRRMQLVVIGAVSSTNIWAEKSRTPTTHNVRVKVIYGSGSENLRDGVMLNDQPSAFVIRTKTGVTNKDHFIWDSIKYNITNIQYEGRKRFMKCKVKKMDG